MNNRNNEVRNRYNNNMSINPNMYYNMGRNNISMGYNNNKLNNGTGYMNINNSNGYNNMNNDNAMNASNSNINENIMQNDSFKNNQINIQSPNNNMNNSNKNSGSIHEKLKGIFLRGRKSLNDKNNINNSVYEKYRKDMNNTENKSTQKQIFSAQYEEKTNDPNVNKQTIINISSYDVLKINVEQITDEEKRTTVKIFGTSLPSKGGDKIVKILEELSLENEEKQEVYDMVYLPDFSANNINRYFVINFRKSSYIKIFDDVMKDYLSKNEENNNYDLYWNDKQGNDLKKDLEEKRQKKNFKGFIKFF